MTPEEREKHRLYMREYRKKNPYKPLTGERLEQQRKQQREYQRQRSQTEEGKAAMKAARKRHYDKMMQTEEGRRKLAERRGEYKPLKGAAAVRKRTRMQAYMKGRREDPAYKAGEAARDAAWRQTPEAKKYWREYMQKMRGTPEGIVLLAARKRLNELVRLKGAYKPGKTRELIGCTVRELKEHLEAQFTDGMTWDNYGRYGWHIDHIRPCASFDLSDPEQVRQCFHYTNLQPLWGVDNMRKSDRWEPDQAA